MKGLPSYESRSNSEKIERIVHFLAYYRHSQVCCRLIQSIQNLLCGILEAFSNASWNGFNQIAKALQRPWRLHFPLLLCFNLHYTMRCKCPQALPATQKEVVSPSGPLLFVRDMHTHPHTHTHLLAKWATRSSICGFLSWSEARCTALNSIKPKTYTIICHNAMCTSTVKCISC